MHVFFFNDTATTEIYTLSLHDALPIYRSPERLSFRGSRISFSSRCFSNSRSSPSECRYGSPPQLSLDRKSTRLNSSHANISYAVFCLKKKKYSDRVYFQVNL